MSIKQAIIDKNNGNEVEKSEYVNLILDDMQIGEISEEDRIFLEGFTETHFLSLNSTQLKTLANLPKLEKLERLELNDNKIGASQASNLERLAELYQNLRVLKISNNQIKTIEEVAGLAKCEKLESLDLSNNPIASTETGLGEEYMNKVRELLPKLDVLDGINQKGEEVVSEGESDEEDEDEEDGEGEDDEEDEDAEDAEEADGDDGEDEEEGEEEGDEEGDEEQNEEADQETAAAESDAGAKPLVGKKRKVAQMEEEPEE